jgi:hypothetical protein
MVRQRGTLTNFVGDGEISHADVTKLVRMGRVAIGQERYAIVERRDLVKWGVLNA